MGRSRVLGAVGLGILVGMVVLAPASGGAAEKEDRRIAEELRVAYSLLAGSLGSEADMKWLLWLRELTLQGPAKEVERLMTALSEASRKREEELEQLRKLAPDVSGEPPPSPIGNAIQSAAEWEGTKEMLFPEGQFGTRFMFLQAQATRMISVIAAQAADIDPNAKRKQWAQSVSKEYAGYREDLVKAVEKCAPR
jgi:hypothetical protein